MYSGRCTSCMPRWPVAHPVQPCSCPWIYKIDPVSISFKNVWYFLAVSCFCRCLIFFCSFLLVSHTLWNINLSCSCWFLWVSHDLSLVVHMEVFVVDVAVENTKQDWYKASYTNQDHMTGLPNSAVWKFENSQKGHSHLKKTFGPASRFFHNGAGLRGLGMIWRSQNILFYVSTLFTVFFVTT